MSIGPVGGLPPISGFTPLVAPSPLPGGLFTDVTAAADVTASTVGTVSAAGTASTTAAEAAGGGGFVNELARGVDQLQGLQSTADGLAVAAATGDLTDVHDYMIAATQAQLATELTVAVRNKALEAFTEIMRMPI